MANKNTATVFRCPVLSATAPQKGAQSRVTRGRIACSRPMVPGDMPDDLMNRLICGTRQPVLKRYMKKRRRTFVLSSMVMVARSLPSRSPGRQAGTAPHPDLPAAPTLCS
mmetsp:Transcript_25566/g.57625  ORF Transcript_25566/g.57625 Transcript_25566/m.57625 type:complete len:110 (+) Transcript_25566:1377-1706(+)